MSNQSASKRTHPANEHLTAARIPRSRQPSRNQSLDPAPIWPPKCPLYRRTI